MTGAMSISIKISIEFISKLSPFWNQISQDNENIINRIIKRVTVTMAIIPNVWVLSV